MRLDEALAAIKTLGRNRIETVAADCSVSWIWRSSDGSRAASLKLTRGALFVALEGEPWTPTEGAWHAVAAVRKHIRDAPAAEALAFHDAIVEASRVPPADRSEVYRRKARRLGNLNDRNTLLMLAKWHSTASEVAGPEALEDHVDDPAESA